MDRLSHISVERFLVLLLFITIIALGTIYFKSRTIRTAYVLSELQQEYQYWTNEKRARQAELASFNNPAFLFRQLDRYQLQMVVNKYQAPTATDLQLVQSGSTY